LPIKACEPSRRHAAFRVSLLAINCCSNSLRAFACDGLAFIPTILCRKARIPSFQYAQGKESCSLIKTIGGVNRAGTLAAANVVSLTIVILLLSIPLAESASVGRRGFPGR